MLVATAEVLAGVLGDPDGAAKGVMIIVEVRDELLSVSTIPVSGNGIDCAATTAVNELLEPRLPRRSVGRGGGNEGIALGFERLNVLLPELNATSGTDVRLPILIRPV